MGHYKILKGSGVELNLRFICLRLCQDFLFSLFSTLEKMVAAAVHFFSLLVPVFQLCLLRPAHGGVYYGHKQPPHQPLPQHNDGYPQQQFLGNEMPLMPLVPQYGKEMPQLPLQKGKGRPLFEGKGDLLKGHTLYTINCITWPVI